MIQAFNSEVYDRYGLLNLPRTFGFPVQIDIQSIPHLRRIITENDGKFPLFISCNAHNDEYVLLGQVYFDFDGHGFHSISEALSDVKKLAEHLESQNMDFLIDMTGRGFRILQKVKPEIVKIEEVDGIIKGYTKHIKDELKLETLDLKVAEPKRIMRPPLTTYIYIDRGEKIVTKKHILPLDMNTLFDSNLNELVHMSETLQFHVMDVSPVRITIKDMAEYRIKSNTYVSPDVMDDYIDFTTFNDKFFIDSLDEIIRDGDKEGHDIGPDTALIKRLLTVHPSHNDRFLAAIKVKEYHLSYESAVSFFAKLSEVAKWDNRNLEIQAHQIRSIYDKGYGRKVR